MVVNHLTKFGITYTLLIAGILPLTGTMLFQLFLPDWLWSNESIRVAMQAVSAVIALIAAALLLLRKTIEEDVAYFTWVAAAFVSMGLLDGFHVAFSGIAVFEWTRVLVIFWGGGLFSLVWLPDSLARTRFAQRVFPGLIAAIVVLAGVLIAVFPGMLPDLVDRGEFSSPAKAISLLGGLLFLTAAAWFFIRYRAHRKADYLIFASQTLLFGGVGVLLVNSRMWDAVWWSWHGMLLVAYLVVLGQCLYVYSNMRNSLQRFEHLRLDRQASIAVLSQHALAENNLQDLFQEATERLANTLETQYSKVLELMPDGQALLLRAGVGWKDGYVGKALVPVDTGSQAGFTLLSHEPVIVEDLRLEKRFSTPKLLVEHNVVSGMSVIIPANERPFGILAVHSTEPRTFRSDDIEFLQTVANVLATAVERKRAEEALRRQADLLEQTHDAIFVWEFPGRILYWNQGAERLYGFPREEAVGRRSHELLRTEHPIATDVFEAHIGLHGTWSGELTQWTRDGRRIVVESRHVLVREGDNHRLVLETNRDITERKQVEESLRQSEQELRALARQLISAKEEESKRIARELHDGVGQRLALLTLSLAELQGMHFATLDPARGKLQETAKEISSLTKELHDLSHNLHPSLLSQVGLKTTLEFECANYSRQYGTTVEFRSENIPELMSAELALCLYRVTQEGLHNISKHAQAKQATIKLGSEGGEIVLVIQDCGKGFDLDTVRGTGGIGLMSMAERIRLVGGRLDVRTKPGQGTQIEARIPMEGRLK